MNVIIDNNLFISFIIGGKLEPIIHDFVNRKINLLYSDKLINEFEDVILRDKFRKYFSISAAINLKKNIQILGTKVSTTSSINICRDPKDNFLLDLAVDGAADYLITGDKDLLILQQIDKCKIVTWQRFNEIVSQ